MKRKWFLIVSVMMSLLLALSLGFAGCNKKDDDNGEEPGPGPGPTPTPGTPGEAVALIEDEDLDGKFFMMYTFEDEAAISAVPEDGSTLAAIDPYTGEAASSYDGTYLSDDNSVALVSIPTANGGSKYVLNTNYNAIGLGGLSATQLADEFDDDGNLVAAGTHSGLSVSFWAYNYETLVGNTDSGVSADWNNLATTGDSLILWGNTQEAGPTPHYPTAGATIVGRGAYTEASYATAQAELTTAQLGVHNDYTGWNAVAGNKGAADEDGGLIDNIADAYLNTWRYITVNIDYTEGVSFYNNGRLVFTYEPSVFGTTARWNTFYGNFIIGMRSDFRELVSSYVNMFNGITNIYVDDVLVGTSLTAEQACALYEDLSGSTWDADDLTLSGVNSATINQSAYSYTGSTWYQLNVSGVPAWSQITIPTGDFSLTYTADLYSVGTGYTNLSFILYEGAQRTQTPGSGAGEPKMLYIRANGMLGCANLDEDEVASGSGIDQYPVMTYTKEYTDGAFAVGLGEALYTKTETTGGSTTITNLCQDIAFELVAVITKSGDTLTVAYYEGSVADENLVWGFTMDIALEGQVSLAIGGEGTYLENITVTSITTSDSTTPTLSSTTSGARALVDTTGYTPVTAD